MTPLSPVDGFPALSPDLKEMLDIYGEHLTRVDLRADGLRLLATIDPNLKRYQTVMFSAFVVESRGVEEGDELTAKLELFAEDQGIKLESAHKRYRRALRRWREARLVGTLYPWLYRLPREWKEHLGIVEALDTVTSF